MRNLKIRHGDMARGHDYNSRDAEDLLRHMYIVPSKLQKRDEVRSVAPEHAREFALCPKDNVVVSKYLLQAMDAVRKAVPKAIFEVRNTDVSIYGLASVVFLRIEGERFFRAALQYDKYSNTIHIASQHLHCFRLATRVRGSIEQIQSNGGTTVSRSLTLKDVYAEIGRILKRVCAVQADSMAHFETLCFDAQKSLADSACMTDAGVKSRIEQYVGRRSMWEKDSVDDDVRVAAFLALESIMTGTPAPTLSPAVQAQAGAAFAILAQMREDTKVSQQLIPVNVLKFAEEDGFVIRINGHYQRVKQLPDCIVPQVATLMAMGNGATLVGVGAAARDNSIGTPYINPLDLSMVVMVPVGTHI